MENPLLSIKSLKKQYNQEMRMVLPGINLDIYENDFVCILGPSGCGKSTLLRCILGFETFEGSILLNGHAVNKYSTECAMVFQDVNQLFTWKTVIGNITYPLKVKGIKSKRDRINIAENYLNKVNMLDYKDYYPHQLSGGMKQRVAIARTLAMQPDIILMDEPFAALDAMTRNQLERELLNIATNEKVTVLFITHNIQESIILSNRIVMLSSDGYIIKNIYNNIPKPVSPASEGYGEMWKDLNDTLRSNMRTKV